MRYNIARRILSTASLLAAFVALGGASAHAGLTFTPTVISFTENAASATITVDLFGARDQGAQQLLSTYGIRLSSSAGTLTSANSTNAIVQNEWQGFVRQNSTAASSVVFQGGQVDPSAFTSIDIQLAPSRIGEAVFTVLKTNVPQLVSFTLSAGPTRDAPARNGALVTNGTPGGYLDVLPLNFTSTSANVSALAAVPEPSSLILTSLILGGVPYGLRLRRKVRAS